MEIILLETPFSIFMVSGILFSSGLTFDTLDILRLSSEKYVRKHYVLDTGNTLIRNSDVHYLPQIGEIYTLFFLGKIYLKKSNTKPCQK